MRMIKRVLAAALACLISADAALASGASLPPGLTATTPFTAAGGTAAATPAQRSGRTLNVVDDCGAPTNGTSDASSAFNACLSKGVPVVIPTAAGGGAITYAFATPITPPSNSKLSCLGNGQVTLRASAPGTLLNLVNTSGVEFGPGCLIDGNKAVQTGAPAVINFGNTYYAHIHDLTINNPAEGVVVTSGVGGLSAYNLIENVTVNNSANHGFAFANGHHNTCNNCGGNNNLSFGIYLTGTEHDTTIANAFTTRNAIELIGTDPSTYNITIRDPHSSRLTYPAWAAGASFTAGQTVTNAFNVYTAGSTGTAGATPPTCNSGTCSDGTITWTYVSPYASTGDNCISVVGTYTSVIGGNLEGCWRDGVGLYGDHDSVTGVHTLNVAQENNHGGTSRYYGVEFASNFGGLSTFSSVSGNVLEDNQTPPTQYAPLGIGFGYPQWTAGTTYGGNIYVFNGGNIYASLSGGTSGGIAPTCTSGTCSDGSITWTFIRSFTGTTQANQNAVGANTYGASSSGFPYYDTTAFQPNGLIATNNYIAMNGGNQRGAGAIDLQYVRSSNTQVASGLRATAIGSSNSVTNQDALAIGSYNISANTSAVAIGSANANGGSGSVAIGVSNSVLGPASVAVGTLASDRTRRGVSCTANSDFATVGDAQACVTVLRQSTAGSSAVRLTADALVPSSNNLNTVNIPDSTHYELRISLHARDVTTPANSYAWTMPVAILTRGTGVATTALTLGTASTLSTGTVTGASVSATADTTNGGLNLSFTPPRGNTDMGHVVARVESVEVQ